MSYATVAELAEHLGLSENVAGGRVVDSNRTARYQLALDAATQAIRNDTGRDFAAGTAGTAKIIPVFTSSSVLPIPDLVSATEVKVDDDYDGTYETTLTTTDYELSSWHANDEAWPFEIITRLSAYWPCSPVGGRSRLVKITGTWGWAAVPAPIQQACLLLAARHLQRGNSPAGVQGVAEFGAFTIRSSDPDYWALIGPYRKPGIA